MLAFLAAVIPIVGSLYVAGSYLAEQVRLRHELRVRYRVAEVANDHYERVLREQAEGLRDSDISLPGRELDRVTRMLLEANGLGESRPTYTDASVRLAMSGSVQSRTEVRRQWALLASSAVGLVLLAIDVM